MRIRSRSPASTAPSSAAHSTSSSRVVGKKRPFGMAPSQWPERPTRWSATAMETRRAELAREVHRPDVDSEFERCGRHDGPHRTRLEPALGLDPHLPGEASVVGEHRVFGQAFAQHVGQPFRHPPGVDEDEGGVVRFDERGDPVPDVPP